MISFCCPRCHTFQTVDDQQAGGQYACSGCGQRMLVPRSAAAPGLDVPAGFDSPARAEVRYDNGRPFISWHCPHCLVAMQSSTDNVGRAVQCSSCFRPIRVPDPEDGTAPAVAVAGLGYGLQATRPRKWGGLLLALGVTALVAVTAVAGLLLWAPWAGSSSLSAEDTRFLPDGTQCIVVINVDQLLDSTAYRKIEKAVTRLGGDFKEAEQNIRQATGLGWSDFRRVTIGGRFSQRPEFIVVGKTKKAIRVEDIVRRARQRGEEVREDRIGPFTVYTLPQRAGLDEDVSFCGVDDSTLVGGPAEMLREVLRRERAAALAPDLQAVLSQADFSRTFVLAMGRIPRDLPGEVARGLGSPVKLDPFQAGLDRFEGMIVEVRAGSTIDLKTVILCSDENAAEQLNTTVARLLLFPRAQLNLPPPAVQVLDSIKTNVRGKKVTITLTLDPDGVVRLAGRRR
jgi:hypothetical protein